MHGTLRDSFFGNGGRHCDAVDSENFSWNFGTKAAYILRVLRVQGPSQQIRVITFKFSLPAFNAPAFEPNGTIRKACLLPRARGAAHGRPAHQGEGGCAGLAAHRVSLSVTSRIARARRNARALERSELAVRALDWDAVARARAAPAWARGAALGTCVAKMTKV